MVAVTTATLSFSVVPTCKDDREELYGALKHETVALKCEVDANPPVVTFQWTFNNSGDLTDVPPTRYTSHGTVSHLNYTPVSDMDYGTLSCWGSNAVGHQKSPCVFQVVAAGGCHDTKCIIILLWKIVASYIYSKSVCVCCACVWF